MGFLNDFKRKTCGYIEILNHIKPLDILRDNEFKDIFLGFSSSLF